jgi:ABC-type branched-subunit amino acid transport system ATPase component
MLLAEQFLDFATGLADEYCVLDGGVVALASSPAELDRAAVTSFSRGLARQLTLLRRQRHVPDPA